MKMCVVAQGSQLKPNPFLSVRFAISLIAWLSLIPNFIVHRKQGGGVKILYWDCGFFIKFITSIQRKWYTMYTCVRFVMKK